MVFWNVMIAVTVSIIAVAMTAYSINNRPQMHGYVYRE